MRIKRIFLVFLFLVIFSVTSVYATTYYVAKGGSDSNPGTEAQPWLTIQKAADTVQAGDTVYVKAGTYNEEVKLTTSGSVSEGYITFQNYGTDEVILDGTGLGTTVLMFYGYNISYVRVKGLHVTNFEGGGIVIRTSNETHSHIEIRDCEISNQGAGEPGMISGSIYVSSSYLGTGLITDVIIDGNYIHDVENRGDEALAVGYEIERFQITNNIVENTDNICICIRGRERHPTDGIVAYNEVRNCGSKTMDAGIYIGSPAKRVTIEKNIVYGGSGGGIVIGGEEEGLAGENVIVRYNTVYNNLRGIGLGSSNIPGGTANRNRAVHNTVYAVGDSKYCFNLASGENNVYKNNIAYNSTSGRHVSHFRGTEYSPTLDYNCYYPDLNNGWQYKGTIYSNFANYQSQTGQDQNGFVANPKFVNPVSDFSLQSGSPCIDTGGFLTKTTSSGSGTTLVVEDARYFTDGYGVIEGDLIQVGSNDPVRVVNVDYNTNTITVDRSISWNAGDGVSYPYSGSAPDIGAYEQPVEKTCSEKGGTCCLQGQECQGGTFVSSSDCGNLCCVGGTCTTPTTKQITALKTLSPITIDGELNEYQWSQANYITFSNPSVSDNQVKVLTLWDNNNLYLAYEVTDFQLEAVETNRDGYVWEDDGVEFYLDTLNDKSAAMQTDDYHFIVNINDIICDSQGTGVSGNHGDKTWNSNIITETKTTANGYITEVKIPWLDMNVSSPSDKTMGLLLCQNDRDTGISKQYDWIGGISWSDPSKWGEFLLSNKTITESDAPTVLDIKFTEVGKSQEITSIKKDKWYDLYIYVDDPQGFQDISFADLWLNSPSYTEGIIDNRGGNHYAASSYIWLYSIITGGIYAKETEGTADWTRITGILGLYTDDDSNEFEVNSQGGWAKARVKLLYDAEVGSWKINGYVRDKKGNKSSLHSETVSVTSEFPGIDLVLLLHFDEGSGDTAFDSSGYGNDGTIYGANWIDGKIGSAPLFDGVDDYVDCGNNSSLDITDEITIEAWIKASSTQPGVWNSIVNKGVWRYYLGIDGSRKVEVCVNDASCLKASNGISADVWHHIAWVHSTSPDQDKIYVDGITTTYGATGNLPNPLSDPMAKLAIGRYISSAWHQFNGIIDEVKIYNRALSAEEILQHAGSGR